MLPKVNQPTFSLTVPSTGKEIRYRPFTVREEKILLVAQASGETKDYINAFKQLITNCVLDPIDADKLASYDIEYIFLNLRAKSVSNVVELTLKDEGKDVKLSVNLNDVQVHKATVSNKIVLDADQEIGIKLKYPTFDELSRLAKREDGETTLDDGLELLIDLIDLIWQGEAVHAASEASRQELREFVNDFTADHVKAIEAFLEDLPFVYLDVKWTDAETGAERTRRIQGLQSFFS